MNTPTVNEREIEPIRVNDAVKLYMQIEAMRRKLSKLLWGLSREEEKEYHKRIG